MPPPPPARPSGPLSVQSPHSPAGSGGCPAEPPAAPTPPPPAPPRCTPGQARYLQPPEPAGPAVSQSDKEFFKPPTWVRSCSTLCCRKNIWFFMFCTSFSSSATFSSSPAFLLSFLTRCPVRPNALSSPTICRAQHKIHLFYFYCFC